MMHFPSNSFHKSQSVYVWDTFGSHFYWYLTFIHEASELIISGQPKTFFYKILQAINSTVSAFSPHNIALVGKRYVNNMLIRSRLEF